MSSQHGVEVTPSATGVRLRGRWWSQWWLLISLAGFALYGLWSVGGRDGDWTSAGFMAVAAGATAAWLIARATGTVEADRDGVYFRKPLAPGRRYEWRGIREVGVQEWSHTDAQTGSRSTKYWATLTLSSGETVPLKMGGSDEQAQLITHHIDQVRQRWDLSHI